MDKTLRLPDKDLSTEEWVEWAKTGNPEALYLYEKAKKIGKDISPYTASVLASVDDKLANSIVEGTVYQSMSENEKKGIDDLIEKVRAEESVAEKIASMEGAKVQIVQIENGTITKIVLVKDCIPHELTIPQGVVMLDGEVIGR